MKKLIILIITLSLILLNGCAIKTNKNIKSDSLEWQTFNLKNENSQVKFPSTPKYSTDNINLKNGVSLKSNSYTSELNNGEVFIINNTIYPKDTLELSDNKTILKNSLDGVIKSTKGDELLSSFFTTYNNRLEINYNIKNTSNKFYLAGRSFILGKKLYQMMYYSKLNKENEISYNRFFNSFKIN